jgi:glutamine synthetase
MATDTGVNLLEPGNTPIKNAQFLLVLAAVIKAVDEHQDLLRVTVASAGNDHRLGANEAPPAIVSIFLGDELTGVLESIDSGEAYNHSYRKEMTIGVDILPPLPLDTTDRNRTSPFAFTGNKFEFRMVGSSFSIADSNTILNTIVAASLCEFADALEKATDFTTELNRLIRDTIKKHKRIVFNGNNYAKAWEEEAQKRGLLNLKSTDQALPYLVKEKNIALFEKFGVLTPTELHARYEILVENYIKVLTIEALTMLDIARKEILPAVSACTGKLAATALAAKQIAADAACVYESALVKKISQLTGSLYEKANELDSLLFKASHDEGDSIDTAVYFRNNVVPAMEALRAVADELETMVGKSDWPFPTYGDLLFGV